MAVPRGWKGYYTSPWVCEQCGKEFFALRSTARFCSNACKQANYRKMREQKEIARKLQLRLPFNDN